MNNKNVATWTTAHTRVSNQEKVDSQASAK